MNIKNILRIKGLKYWVATALFLLVILFLDSNNLLVTLRLHREVSALADSTQKLQQAIQQENNASTSIDNIDDKERFGRETYFMKRENEVIYKRKMI